MSDDLSAEFATLPLHLSFERLREAFEKTTGSGKSLAHSVAELQENGSGPSSVDLNNSGNGSEPSTIATLLEAAREAGPQLPLTAEQRAKWDAVVEGLGGSSWGGSSENGFGGSSPA